MKRQSQVDIVVCGAGIAGVATAYYLTHKYKAANVVLVDKQQPLSYTTAMSGENFRDYWPQVCLKDLVIRSIDLMAEFSPEFELKNTGYDFVSLEKDKDIFTSSYEGDDETFLSRETSRETIQARYAYLSHAVKQIVSVKRAGSFDVYALGSLMLSKAKKAGVRFVKGEIDGITSLGSAYKVSFLDDKTQALVCNKVVLASGPFIDQLAEKLDLSLPVKHYLQRKFVMPDPKGIIPRDMPFTIFSDNQYLDWTAEEKVMISELVKDEPNYRFWLDEFPAGLHIKPEGVDQIKLGWAYNRDASQPMWDVPIDDNFAELVVRGASKFIPGLKAYIGKMPTPIVHFGGYYTRTEENWPLIGPLPMAGVYIAGALAGYGTMSACAVGELCSDWLMSGDLPTYADHFHINRYQDAHLILAMGSTDDDGQL